MSLHVTMVGDLLLRLEPWIICVLIFKSLNTGLDFYQETLYIDLYTGNLINKYKTEVRFHMDHIVSLKKVVQ